MSASYVRQAIWVLILSSLIILSGCFDDDDDGDGLVSLRRVDAYCAISSGITGCLLGTLGGETVRF